MSAYFRTTHTNLNYYYLHFPFCVVEGVRGGDGINRSKLNLILSSKTLLLVSLKELKSDIDFLNVFTLSVVSRDINTGLTILDWTQSCENCCYII